jgi:hypothetical protein
MPDRPSHRASPDRRAPSALPSAIANHQIALSDAVAAGQLGPAAASERGLALPSGLHFGVLSQHLANDPEGDWDNGPTPASTPPFSTCSQPPTVRASRRHEAPSMELRRAWLSGARTRLWRLTSGFKPLPHTR